MIEPEAKAHRVLALAMQLGNVAEACRRCGVTRTQFYRYRKMAQRGGGQTKSTALSGAGRTSLRQNLLGKLALKHPTAGLQDLTEQVRAETGLPVSYRTIQSDLGKLGLGTRRQRWLALEKLYQMSGSLSAEQCGFVERFNPLFAQRASIAELQGAHLYQGILFAGKYGDGKLPLYIHYVLDTSSLYMFGMAHHNKRPDASVVLLRQHVMPYFKQLQMPIVQIRTDRSSTFNGRASHLYRLFLTLFRIDHLMQRSTMAEGYRSAVVDAFKTGALQRMHQERRVTLHQIAAAVQEVVRDHNEQPRPGFPNWGDSPQERIQVLTKGATRIAC